MSYHLLALRHLSVGWSVIDLLCWSVCSWCLTICRHSIHVHMRTHTHTRTHATWPFNGSDDSWVTENLLIYFPPTSCFFCGATALLTCFHTSLCYRYEVTQWTVTALSVQTCRVKVNILFVCLTFIPKRVIQQRQITAVLGPKCINFSNLDSHISALCHPICTSVVPQRGCFWVRSLVHHHLTFPVMK